MTKTRELLKEAMRKHRHIKKELLEIIDKAESRTATKERLKELLFNLYLEIK